MLLPRKGRNTLPPTLPLTTLLSRAVVLAYFRSKDRSRCLWPHQPLALLLFLL